MPIVIESVGPFIAHEISKVKLSTSHMVTKSATAKVTFHLTVVADYRVEPINQYH